MDPLWKRWLEENHALVCVAVFLAGILILAIILL